MKELQSGAHTLEQQFLGTASRHLSYALNPLEARHSTDAMYESRLEWARDLTRKPLALFIDDMSEPP